MLANVLTKSLRDRWVGTTVGAVSVAVWLLLAMAAYQTIDMEIYAGLPDAMRSVMGIPEGADVATLAYSVVFGLIGGMTLAGLALSMGASSVAGEERDGTIALLLANPRSRRHVLLAKGVAMVGLVTLGSVVLLLGAYATPAVLGIETGESQVLAVVVHLYANGLLWGSMAMAVGAVTGNRSLASAATAGTMVLSYFLAGLLPLFESVAELAKALPWWWFDGHAPLTNGIDGGWLALQLGTAAVLWGVAWWGVESRDLRQANGAVGLIASVVDRVRSDERAARVLDRLAGHASVRGITAKTAAEGRVLLVVTAAYMFLVQGLLMGPLFVALEDSLLQASGSMPETFLAMVGGGDMSTPEGYYRLETFGLMAPIAAALVGGAVGVRALAGEERGRTIGLLLASPVSRRQVVLRKWVALVLHVAVVGAATFAGTVAGSVVAGLGMSTANIAAVCLQLTLLGVMFGTLALALGAATGVPRTSTTWAIGVFAGAYAIDAALSVSESLEGWLRLSPFEWYLGGEPLLNGFDWVGMAPTAGFTALFLLAAVVLYERRDLRQA